MPSAERHYVIPFTSPNADGGQPHWMIFSLDETAPLKPSLRGFLLSHLHLCVGLDQEFRHFPSKPLAQAHADKLRDDANAANPDRVGAEQQFPDAPNRILEVGKAAAEVVAADASRG